MTTSRVLVVCTANICRSPLVERLFAEYFVRRTPDVDVQVSSAGTRARPGHTAADGMQRVAEGWGLDLSYHRSRRVDSEIARHNDLIVTMEDRHRSTVSRLAAGLGQRTFAITELHGIIGALEGDGADPALAGDPADEPAVVRPAGMAGEVARWHAARARLSLDAPDIPDPYGGSAEDYERIAWRLAGLVEDIGPALARAAQWPPAGRE